MLEQIPTHLIAGPLGAGKTSLLRQLLAQRPAGERWALLINEFGEVGLDAALLARDEAGVSFAEVAGGCLCCVNGVPFSVALGRLLRRAQPQRLFIEPSGLGHPAALLQQLSEAPWEGVLALQPPVLVLDAAALAAGKPLPPAQQDMLSSAGLLLLNKAEGLDPAQREVLGASLPARPLYWSEQGYLPLAALPHAPSATPQSGFALDGLPNAPAPFPMLWTDPSVPLRQIQDAAEGWSIGWRFHPSQRFAPQRLQVWLAAQHWQRAKLVIQDEEGGCALNLLPGSPFDWQPSAWRRDSRIELIFAQAQDIAALERGLLECRSDRV